VWIAENIGEDFPQDHKVDEASALAATPTTRGAFTLARPEDGWAPGDYRVEFLCRRCPRRRGEDEDRAVNKERRLSSRRGALERRPSLNFLESKTQDRRIITEKTYFT
jgi:hypothetical protein